MNISQWPNHPRVLAGLLTIFLCLSAPAGAQESKPLLQEAASCVPGPTQLCLLQNRFRAEVRWRDFSGNRGSGQVVPFGSPDSGLFWFFQANNWEMLVKMVDGCNNNQRFWVYAAATTDVEYTLTVTDTVSNQSKTYNNRLGQASPAITDSSAFATCSSIPGLPPDPGAAGRQTLQGIDSDQDGIRDDLQRHIALTYSGSSETVAALRQATAVLQQAILDAASRPAAIDHATDITRAVECLYSVRPADARNVYATLLSSALNTEARGLAYLRHNDQLAGESFPLQDLGAWSTSCDFTRTSDGFLVPRKSRVKAEGAVCGTGDTTIFFGNGVWNDFAGAQESLGALTSAVHGAFTPEELESINFSLAFNPSGGKLADLWEALKQDLQTDFSRFFRILSGIEIMPDFFRRAVEAQALESDAAAVVDSAVLQRHISLYKGEIFEGKKVVLVSHSQGNFFANQAFPNLSSEEQQSFGIVSVANPDSFVADGGPHVTLSEDLLIAYLLVDRPFGVRPMTPNTRNGLPFQNDDWMGHMFTKAYMTGGSSSRAKILNHIREVRNSLESPTGSATDGIITVTLTWGDEPDVDLHVFEPNGFHVYYSDREGISGFLDFDDTTGRGPEHYFVSCGRLEPGTYRIGLNYFRGSIPEVAEVQVKAGLSIRTFQVVLPQAFGFGGDDSPVPVADIVVTGSEEQGYELQIVDRTGQ